MGTPAADIDEAIDTCDNNVAEVAYGAGSGPPTLSLYDQFQLWIAGMFSEATGIFKPSGNETSSNQRVVTDWLSQHIIARSEIEGQAIGDAGIVGTLSL